MALLALILFICATSTALTHEITPFFRKDYLYDAALNKFYKLHHDHSWDEAKEICEAEGASLTYPDNTAELEFITKLGPPGVEFWVGAHDNFVPGKYVTLEGENLKIKLAPMYPNHAFETRTGKKCATLGGESKIVFLSECWHNKSAVCSKRVRDLTYNQPCQTYDPAYVPSPEKTKCYKMHTEPKSWSKAYLLCQMEEANLAVIENSYDKSFIRKLFAEYPSENIHDDFDKATAFIGYKKIFDHWSSIHGMLMHGHIGINDANNGYRQLACGSVDREGNIRKADCADAKLFICERKTPSHKMIAVVLDEEEIKQNDVKDEPKNELINQTSNPSSPTIRPYLQLEPAYDTNDEE